MLLVGDNGLAHALEQLHHLVRMLLCRIDSRHDECHRRQLCNGDVWNDEVRRNHLPFFCHPLFDALRLDACSHHDECLLVVIHHVANAGQHLLHEPGLDNHAYDVGTLCCQLVARRRRHAQVSELVACCTHGVAHADVLVLDIVSLDEPFNDGTTHGTGSDY